MSQTTAETAKVDLSRETKRPCVPVFSGDDVVNYLNGELGEHALFFNAKLPDPRSIMRAMTMYDNREVALVVIVGDPDGNSEMERIIDGAAGKPVTTVNSYDWAVIVDQIRIHLKLDPPA